MASSQSAARSDAAGSGDSAAGGQSRHCALCKKPETTPGQFLACAQCRRACYCSRDCQRADYYKGHSECVVGHLHTALQSGPLAERQIKQALKLVVNAATPQQHLQAAQLLAKATALCTYSDPRAASATWAACDLLPTIISHLTLLQPQVKLLGMGPPAVELMDAVDLYCLTLCWALHWPGPGESHNIKGACLLWGTSPLRTLLLRLVLIRAIAPETVAPGLRAELEWAVRGAGVMALQGYLLALQDGPAALSGVFNNAIVENGVAGPIICRRLVQLLGLQPGCDWLPGGMAGPYGTFLVAALTSPSGAGLPAPLSELYSEEDVMGMLADAITQASESGSAITAGKPDARDELSCGQVTFESHRSPQAKALSALAALEVLVKAAVDNEGWEGLDRVAGAGAGAVAKAVVALVAAIMDQLEAADCAAGMTDQLLARALRMLAALSEVGPLGMEEALPSLLPKWLAALPLVNQECRQLALALAGVLVCESFYEHGTWLCTREWPRAESSLVDRLGARRVIVAAKVREKIDLREPVVAGTLVACLDACHDQHTQGLAVFLLARLVWVQPLTAQVAVPLFRAVRPDAAVEEQEQQQMPPPQSDWLPFVRTCPASMGYEVVGAVNHLLGRPGDPPLVEIREFLLEIMAQPMGQLQEAAYCVAGLQRSLQAADEEEPESLGAALSPALRQECAACSARLLQLLDERVQQAVVVDGPRGSITVVEERSLQQAWAALQVLGELAPRLKTLATTILRELVHPLLSSSTCRVDAAPGPPAVLQWELQPQLVPAGGSPSCHIEAGLQRVLGFLADHLLGRDEALTRAFGEQLWGRLVASYHQLRVQPLLADPQCSADVADHVSEAAEQLEEFASCLGFVTEEGALSAAVGDCMRAMQHRRQEPLLAEARSVLAAITWEGRQVGKPLQPDAELLQRCGRGELQEWEREDPPCGWDASAGVLPSGTCQVTEAALQLQQLLERAVTQASASTSVPAAQASCSAAEGIALLARTLPRAGARGRQLVAVPQMALLLHNDLHHLAACLLLSLVRQAPALRAALGDCQPLGLLEAALGLRQAADEVLGQQVAAQQQHLDELLAPLEGFSSGFAAPDAQARRKAVSQVQYAISRLGRTLLEVLAPAPLVDTAARVLGHLAARLCHDITSKRNIGADESRQLAALLQPLAEEAVRQLLGGSKHDRVQARYGLPAEQVAQMILARCQPLRKLQLLVVMLDAKMSAIVEMWQGGRLGGAGFTQREVVQLLEALFEDTPYREESIAGILRGGRQ